MPNFDLWCNYQNISRDSSWYQTSLKRLNWSLLLQLYVSWYTNWQKSSIMLEKLEVNKNTLNSCRMSRISFYYPTLLRRVQIMCETSTNITRYLYSSYSSDRTKDQKSWQVRILGERKRWIINLLLDILVCSIAVNFYSSFVFWLALRAHQNTAWLVKIYSDTTH